MSLPTKEDELDFERMWEQARVRFQARTKKSLKPNREKSLDEAIKELDRSFEVDDTVSEKPRKQKVKELARNALNCINLLGGLVAQGASMVFGPATMCFNAVQFLINIPAKMDTFYANLAQLFEEVCTFMMQFQIYKRVEQFAHVDVELKKGAHKLMICFVDICALSISTFNSDKWYKKLRTTTKLILFDDDSGVGGMLAEFRRLIQHQGQISDAIALEHIMKVEKNTDDLKDQVGKGTDEVKEELSKVYEKLSSDSQVQIREMQTMKDTLVSMDSKQKQKEEQDKDMEVIMKRLNVKVKDAQRQREDLDQVRRDSIPNTGSWIYGLEAYTAWKKGNSERTSLLFLTGGAGSGASHIVSAIKEDLEAPNKVASSSTPNGLVACFAFEHRLKRSGNPRDGINESKNAVSEALKSMAVQLASVDDIYSKDLAADLAQKKFDELLASEQSLCLFPPSNTKGTREFTYYLLLDDVTYLTAQDMENLLQAMFALKSPKIRCVIAADEEFFRKALEKLDRSLEDTPIIKIEENNGTDIKEYINFKISKSPLFEGKNSNVRNVVTAIREKLPDLAAGNFGNVEIILGAILDAMQQEQSEEDIKALLDEKVLVEQKDAPARLIQQLNDDLNEQQIEQVNELLMWSTYGAWLVTVNELRAALYLKTQTQPWESLEKRLEGPYGQLFEDLDKFQSEDQDSPWVMVKDSVATYLCDTPRARSGAMASGENSRFSLEIKIENATLPQIQRFIWDLNEKATLERFVFDNPERMAISKPKITANPIDSHLALARKCFTLIFEDQDPNTAALMRYATTSIFSHLRSLKLSQAGKLDTEEKREMGRKMIRLLKDPDIIEKHLTKEFTYFPNWLYTDTQSTILTWLQDPDAMDGVDSQDRGWMRKLRTQPPIAPLKPVTMMIARHWLGSREISSWLLFQWMDRFIEGELNPEPIEEIGVEKQEKSEDDKDQDEDGDQEESAKVEESVLTVEQRITRALEWAKTEAKCDDNNPLWYERLGELYMNEDRAELAVKALLKAKEFPSCPSSVSTLLISAYDTLGRFKEALEESQLFISTQQNGTEKSEEVITALFDAAFLHMGLGDDEAAIKKFHEALELKPSFYQAHRNLLKFLVGNSRAEEALQHVRELHQTPGEKEEGSRLKDLFMDSCQLSEEPHYVFESIFAACKGNETEQIALEALETSLKESELLEAEMNDFDKGKHLARKLVLLFWKGVALARLEKDQSSWKLALELWEHIFRLGVKRGKYDVAYTTGEAAFHVASIGLSFSIASGHAPTEVESHVKRMNDMISASTAQFPVVASDLRMILSGYYNLVGQRELAKEGLAKEMKLALDLLSDDDPTNDHVGYSRMVDYFAHTGDDLNALSASSLCGPSDRDEVREKRLKAQSSAEPTAQNENLITSNGAPAEDTKLQNGPADVEGAQKTATEDPSTKNENQEVPKDDAADANEAEKKAKEEQRTGPLGMRCDGRCDKEWSYSDEFYECKICSDVQFCVDCMPKVKNGTLVRRICAADHSFLYFPPWSDDDYFEVGPDNVRIEGEIVDGKRVGGRIVPIETWLDMVRESWGIEKPTVEVKAAENEESA